jgi:predicted anti-sigma-YlaC factor YlaD
MSVVRAMSVRDSTRLAVSACAVLLGGCSIKQIAINKLGDALAQGGSTYASDDDPELVGEAIPFGLKTIESLLAESPRHKGLLFAAASGFTQYGYAYVQQEADFVEERDFERAKELRGRAVRLYKRALDYGLRGLEADFPGFREGLRRDRAAALLPLRKKHVPLLYWTGLSWFAAIGVNKADSDLSADQALAEALMHRALELDPGFDYGSIHDFYVAWETRGEAVGGSYERAREHFERALLANGGHRAATYVGWAEGYAVAKQDRPEFERLLQQALAVDVDVVPELRLSNLLYQKRARWLMSRGEELFIE